MSKTAAQLIELLQDEANFLFDNKKIGVKAYKTKVGIIKELQQILNSQTQFLADLKQQLEVITTNKVESSNDFKAVYYFAKLSGINPDNVLILAREPGFIPGKKWHYNTKKLAAELKTIYELNPGRIFKPWELQKVIAIKNIFVNGPGEQPPEPGQYITTEQNQSIKFQI